MDPKDRIPAEWPDLNVREMLRRLVSGGVDFVVIGGIAVLLLGYPRNTRDLDIAFAHDAGNLEALGRVLVELEARLRGVEADLPFVPDQRTLQGIELLTLETSEGWLDVQRRTPGVRSYERLRQQRRASRSRRLLGARRKPRRPDRDEAGRGSPPGPARHRGAGGDQPPAPASRLSSRKGCAALC